MLRGVIGKPAQGHGEIKETGPWHLAHAADHQRGNHRTAFGDVFTHGLFQCDRDTLNGARWLQTELLGQFPIGDAGIVWGPPGEGIADLCGKGIITHEPTPTRSATSSKSGSAA